MHPEIVREAPGACPLCGMALEPRVVTAEEEKNPELVDMTRRFCVSAALTVPLLVIAMGQDSAFLQSVLRLGRWSPRALAWMEFALATPVVLWGAGRSLCAAGHRW